MNSVSIRGVTYDSELVHAKVTNNIISILPVCQGCKKKLDYEDIKTREGVTDGVWQDGQGGYVKMGYGIETCRFCGYIVGDWGDQIPCDKDGNIID